VEGEKKPSLVIINNNNNKERKKKEIKGMKIRRGKGIERHPRNKTSEETITQTF
jgi:hypothetical protein